MLSDLTDSFTTSLAPAHRALGYLDEALDMRRRARINREAWRPHLDHSRQFVLSSAHRCANKDKIVILGSGLLLDVPLAELSEMFGEVVLKDVVCLPEVRKQIKIYGNVTFVEKDVTGLAGRLHRNRQQGITGLPEAPPPPACDGASLVVSLNILSQLWVVPRAFIGRLVRAVPPEQVDEWCAGIVEAHYAGLRKLGGDACLVGDYEFIKRDREGRLVSRGSTVYGLDLPEPADRWTWNIAPLGAGNRYTSKELLVGAWLFRNGAG